MLEVQNFFFLCCIVPCKKTKNYIKQVLKIYNTGNNSFVNNVTLKHCWLKLTHWKVMLYKKTGYESSGWALNSF